MRVRISSFLLRRVVAMAQAEQDEVCGLLLGEAGWIRDITPAANVAPDPARHFEVDPVVLIAAHRQARMGGSAVIGHYHSHPSGHSEPSANDEASAAADGSYWMIVANGAARLWQTTAGEGGEVRFVAVELDIL
ncbi:M67 family metallopeptidase [Sphingobium vermicomposti]|uniref:Proteasome lid subunit RPN8/RPN11 n=1 Tax=Sphingobium vermicomposti TaxID=529005 RepID=A0A846M2N8_9SPHN|nr:M67 family metallopeptidase [Sphingobium vermicomposti]NIJ16192.1 proteasome lid subunit RPN8/RPN11 [Sphingobium vermicomposti]